MNSESYSRHGELKTVMQLIYEYKKGIRSLLLCTLCPTCVEIVAERLDRQGIGYLVQPAGSRNVNLFFGDPDCLEAVACFIHKPLHQLTPEEDFMLGAMLGYGITKQCRRFCERRQQAVRSVN